MKKLLTLLAFTIPTLLISQSQVWQVPVVHNNIQVRLPRAYVLDSITIQVPDTGSVFLRFEGTCTTTPGDVILLAASNRRNWYDNDGNTGAYSIDSLNRTRPFNHTRVYRVPGGTTQTFYAVTNNWTDQNGDGIVSINGQLTVMYVPNTATDFAMSGRGFNVSIDDWNNVPTVIDTVQIHVPTSGTLMINCDGKLYTSKNDTVQLAVSLSPQWPSDSRYETFNMPNATNHLNFAHRKSIHVEAGTHTLYALVRKLDGFENTSWNGVYTTLTALFIPDESVSVKGEVLPGTSLDDDGPVVVKSIEVDVTDEGKVYLSLTGRLESHVDDSIRFSLEHLDGTPVILDELNIRSLFTGVHTAITLSAVVPVTPGKQVFRLLARYADESTGTGEAEISGFLTADFFAEEELTSTKPVVQAPSMTFYPNPTTGEIHSIASQEVFAGVSVINVYDVNGQLKQQAVADNNNIKLDLRDFANGMYMISVQQGDAVQVHPVLKISADQ